MLNKKTALTLFIAIALMMPALSLYALTVTPDQAFTESAGTFAGYVAGVCYFIGILLIGWAFITIVQEKQEPDIQKFIKFIAFAILAMMAGKVIEWAANVAER